MTAKTYFHRTPGARFILPDGRDISFAGGRFRTEDEVAITELDKVANKAASQIYTTNPVKGAEEAAVIAEIAKSATVAFDGENKITGPTETIPMPVAPDPKPVLNAGVPAAPAPVDLVAKARASLAAASAKKPA